MQTTTKDQDSMGGTFLPAWHSWLAWRDQEEGTRKPAAWDQLQVQRSRGYVHLSLPKKKEARFNSDSGDSAAGPACTRKSIPEISAAR